MTCRSRAHPPHALILSGMLFAFSLIWLFSGARSKPGVDFYHFWAVPKGVALGYPREVYTPAGRQMLGRMILDMAEHSPGQPRFKEAARIRAVWDKTGSPGLYAVMGFVSLADYDTSLMLFRIAALASFAGALMLIGWRCLNIPAVPLLILGSLMLTFNEPMRSELEVGNLNLFQLLLLGVLIRLSAARSETRWPAVAQGFLVGAALAVKLNLYGVFILLTLIRAMRGDWAGMGRWLAGAAAGAAAVIVWACIFFGYGGVWLDWQTTLADLVSGGFPTRSGNFSIVKALDERTGWNASLPLNALLFGAAAAVVWASVRQQRRGEMTATRNDRARFLIEANGIAIGAAIPLLTSQIAWWHYYLLAIPLLLLAFRPREDGERPAGRWRLGAAVAALALFSSWPIDPVYLLEQGLLEVWIARMALSVAILLALAGADMLHLVEDAAPRDMESLAQGTPIT